MWEVEIFRMSLESSYDLLVYITILWIVDFCINELINEMSILEFFYYEWIILSL